MKTVLFNPFIKYSEKQLLLVGLLFTIVGSLAGYYLNARFDGALDMHIGRSATMATVFSDNAISIISLFIPLYLLALYINNKTRIVDILNTILVARLPIYLITLSNAGKFISQIEQKIDVNNPSSINLESTELIVIIITALLSLLFLVWYIALLYNGFKVACNAKTVKHNILFGVALLVAEILSKTIISIIN